MTPFNRGKRGGQWVCQISVHIGCGGTGPCGHNVDDGGRRVGKQPNRDLGVGDHAQDDGRDNKRPDGMAICAEKNQ